MYSISIPCWRKKSFSLAMSRIDASAFAATMPCFQCTSFVSTGFVAAAEVEELADPPGAPGAADGAAQLAITSAVMARQA